MPNRALQNHPGRLAGRLSAAAALLVLFGAAEALARPVVTVADFTEVGRRGHAGKARGRIVRALQDEDQVRLLPFAQVEAIGRSRRVRGAALLKPAVLGKFAQQAGADVAVTGSVRRAGRHYWLEVKIVGTSGRELWSKEVELERGELSRDLATRFAAAIAAASGVRAPSTPSVAALTPSEPQPGPGPRELTARSEPAGDEPHGVGSEPSGPARRPEAEVEVVPYPRGEPRGEPGLEPGLEPGGGRPDYARPAVAAGPPIFDFSLGLTMTWRNYDWCPEVENCGEKSPPTANSVPLKYSTGAPYSGVLLKFDLFPLARNEIQPLRGLGLGAGFNYSPKISTAYPDPATGESVSADSSQHRFWFEGVYRYYFGLSDLGTGWVGLRAGYSAFKFSITENPVVLESDRGGFFATLDLGLPLGRYVGIEARGSLVPYASPGEKEREKYGVAASGGGFSGAAGLRTDFGHPEWHLGLGAFFEFAHFGDRYLNYEDEHPEFGRALEDYKGLTVAVTARY